MFGLTMDCREPRRLAAFWATALGYVDAAPPDGYHDWEEWLAAHGVPAEEWDDAAYLDDPAGRGPRLSLLRVPEAKAVKNRMHIDVRVDHGRDAPAPAHWSAVHARVEELTAAGASVVATYEPDHVVMADPEGNEFCVV